MGNNATSSDNNTTTTNRDAAPGETDTPSAPARKGRARKPRTRRRKIIIRVASAFAVLLIAVGAAGGWALNRYVIDHVEIADVAAYEAAMNAATSTPTDPSTDTSAVIETASTATSAPTLTDTTYTDGATTITITKVVSGSGGDTVTYYVADVVLADTTTLRSAFANNEFGTNIVADTSDIASDSDAVFAINGDYYGFRTSGIVIRNGVVYRDDGARTGLAIYKDGTMRVYDETATTAAQLVADGVWNTLSFGPALLEDGQILEGIEDVEVDTNFGNHSIQGNQPRTGLAMISANHFVFVAVDGRSSGYSKGVTMTEFAQIFKSLGATVAYNLDGGGSTTMYFNGKVVNNPLGNGNERGTSDILYIGGATADSTAAASTTATA